MRRSLAEHRGHARVGRDDHVRVVGADQAHQPAAAEERQQPARQPAGRPEVHEQPVLEVEQPRHEREHEGRVLAQDLGEDRPHRRQAVDDRDLGVGILVLELARDRAGGKVVALADVGGDDQDLAGLGLGVGLAGRDDHGLLLVLGRLDLGQAPVDVAAHALVERRGGGPAQLLAGPLRGDDLAAEVAGPGGRVDDLHVAHQLLDGLGDLLDRHRLVAGQVVDAVDGDVVEAARDAVGEVLDVDELAALHAVAGERQRIAGQRLVDERRDDRRLAGARAVRDAEAQDRVVDPVELLVGLAVQLAGELGGRVEVAGRRQQRLLVDLVGLAVGVDPDRRRVDDPLDAGAARRLEHRHRPARVDALGVLGRGVDVVDVGHGRQVGDRVTGVQRPLQRLAVGDRAEHRLDRLVGVQVPRRGPQVIDHRLVPARAELVDDVGADESRPTGDENPHENSLIRIEAQPTGR